MPASTACVVRHLAVCSHRASLFVHGHSVLQRPSCSAPHLYRIAAPVVRCHCISPVLPGNLALRRGADGENNRAPYLNRVATPGALLSRLAPLRPASLQARSTVSVFL
jgi:hypothetical protein